MPGSCIFYLRSSSWRMTARSTPQLWRWSSIESWCRKESCSAMAPSSEQSQAEWRCMAWKIPINWISGAHKRCSRHWQSIRRLWRGCITLRLSTLSSVRLLLRSRKTKRLCRKARPTPAALGRVRIDEVEPLPHQRLFKIKHHAVQVDEALGIDEDADRRSVRRIARGRNSCAERVDTVTLARLRVKANVVAQSGAPTPLNSDAQAALLWRNVLLRHGDANPLQGLLGDLNTLLPRLLPLGRENIHSRERVLRLTGRSRIIRRRHLRRGL